MSQKVVKSNLLAALYGSIAAGVVPFREYWWTDMGREISLLWESREHVNRMFDYWVTNTLWAGPGAAILNHKRSPKDEPETHPDRPAQPVPEPRPAVDTSPPVFFESDPDINFGDFDPPKKTADKHLVHDESRFHNYENWQCPCNLPEERCSKHRRMPDELYRVLIDVSDHFDKAEIFISSGVRCEPYNATLENASSKSQHIVEKACDFVLLGINPAAVHQYLLQKYPDRYGIGEYTKFTHLDIKPGRKRRW